MSSMYCRCTITTIIKWSLRIVTIDFINSQNLSKEVQVTLLTIASIIFRISITILKQAEWLYTYFLLTSPFYIKMTMLSSPIWSFLIIYKWMCVTKRETLSLEKQTKKFYNHVKCSLIYHLEFHCIIILCKLHSQHLSILFLFSLTSICYKLLLNGPSY